MCIRYFAVWCSDDERVQSQVFFCKIPRKEKRRFNLFSPVAALHFPKHSFSSNRQRGEFDLENN